MAKPILGAVLGGIVVFIWSALSWMVIPWHAATMTPFKNDKAVIDVIKANAEKSGVYFSPSDPASMGVEPLIYAAVRRENMTSMAKPMVIGVLIDILCAGLVTWLLLQTSGKSYFGRVGFVAMVALAIGLFERLSDLNWWGFPPAYTAVLIADLVIGWFLAGLVIAKFAAPTLK